MHKDFPLKRAFFEKSRTLQVSDCINNSNSDVFTVSETCFNSAVRNNEINISGYRTVRLDRAKKRGAGLSLCPEFA